MSIFEEKKKEEPPQGMPIDGSFSCMTCGFVVDEGIYFPLDKALVWKCPEGHKSAIENFSIGV